MEPDEDDGDARDVEIIPTSDTLGVLERASIDTQISTAKRYPRSIKAFKAKSLEMATLDEETASSMFYVLPRGKKKIEGPSVRLAEIVGSAWGNIRYGSRIIEVGEKFLTAQGMCFDLETNTQAAVEIRRRITDRNGQRFNDDMVTVTGNAAMSIALRNAIFKVVPFAYVKNIYEEAKLTAIGKNVPMTTRRERAFEFFKKLGATDVQLLALLERPGIEDVTIDDLVTLTGLRTAIKDGDTTIEAVLSDVTKADARAAATVTPESLMTGSVTGQNDAKRPDEKPAESKPEPPASPAAKSKSQEKREAVQKGITYMTPLGEK